MAQPKPGGDLHAGPAPGAFESNPSPAASPASVSELVELVRSTPRLIPVGSRTKARLSLVNAVKISMLKLSGITEYDPSEYTFTALAGTPLTEIIDALGQRGQHLPFDPPLASAGATLGGTVAAGLSGPRRFRFGGIRDFILGVKFVDGTGTVLRMGGKVVKNAAGFDLPKFFVGSLGRFGLLLELTFKVFPGPRNWLTLRLDAKDIEEATKILIAAANSRWEPYALEFLPETNHVLLELGGPQGALDDLSREILGRWKGTKLMANEAEAIWSELKEFRWSFPGGELVKVPLTPKQIAGLSAALGTLGQRKQWRISSGGNIAFVTLSSRDAANDLDIVLRELKLTGMALRGSGPLWYGERRPAQVARDVKKALDPAERFPSLED